MQLVYLPTTPLAQLEYVQMDFGRKVGWTKEWYLLRLWTLVYVKEIAPYSNFLAREKFKTPRSTY